MEFLANENVPRSSIRLLEEGGHDVISIADEMPGATDRQVLEKAIKENRIILTFDRDYGELIFRHKARDVNGIVYFRFTPASPDEAGSILSSLLSERGINLAGMFTVIERDRIRQRALKAIKE